MAYARQRSMSWSCFDDYLAVNFSDSVSEAVDNKLSSNKMTVEEEVKQAFSSKYIMQTENKKLSCKERRIRFLQKSCNLRNTSVKKMMEIISENSLNNLSSSSSVSKESKSNEVDPNVLILLQKVNNSHRPKDKSFPNLKLNRLDSYLESDTSPSRVIKTPIRRQQGVHISTKLQNTINVRESFRALKCAISSESRKSISPSHSICSPKTKVFNNPHLITNEKRQQRCSILKLKSQRGCSFKKELAMRIPKEWEMHQFNKSEYLNSMHYYLKRAYAVDSIIMNKKNVNDILEKYKFDIVERQHLFDNAFNKYIDFYIIKRTLYENIEIKSKLSKTYEHILSYK